MVVSKIYTSSQGVGGENKTGSKVDNRNFFLVSRYLVFGSADAPEPSKVQESHIKVVPLYHLLLVLPTLPLRTAAAF